MSLNGRERRIWGEPVRAGDQMVKGANQVYKRLLELFAGLKQFDMGKNRKGLKGLKFVTLKSFEMPNPEPQAIEPEAASVSVPMQLIQFAVGDKVTLSDGRDGVIVASSESAFSVQDGKPEPEVFKPDDLRFAKGTQVYNLSRSLFGEISGHYPDGCYRVSSLSYSDKLAPSEFEVRRQSSGQI